MIQPVLPSDRQSTGKGNGDEVIVIAKYDYAAQGNQELDLKKNEKLILLDDSKHWWKVLNSKNQSGFVPSNYVKKEKPSIFDSIKKKVKRRSESKSNLSSPVDSPVAAKAIDISIDEPEPSNGTKDESPALASGGSDGLLTRPTYALVRYNYEAQQSDELSLVKGSRLHVLEKSSDGWWRGELGGLSGWFPSNYVQEEAQSPRPEPRTTSRPKPAIASNGSSNGTNGHSYGGSNGHAPHTPPSIRMPVLDIVVALYSFTSQNEEELSFQKGEQLEILDRPANDPDW